MKDKKAIGNSHLGFVKHRSCPTTLTAFVSEMTGSASAADVVHPDHSMTVSIVPPRTTELRTGWVENWLDHQTGRVILSSNWHSQGLEHTKCEGRTGAGFAQPEEKTVGDPDALCSDPLGGQKGDGAVLYSEVHSQSPMCNGHKLPQEKFY